MGAPDTKDFEKLGAFYLGKSYDLRAKALQDELVLYDAKDLTTHAVIIGMTGSGKTGLGIGLLEEAALDHIPVIAIDPKGDLGNLLLTFPKLSAEDFRPWVNTRAAADKGMSADAYAGAQAQLWKNGLADWGQDGARIRRLRESTDLSIYTPGSTAGLPVSLLRSFNAPAAALREDGDLYRDRIQATATSLLALLDIDADPLTSREHILLSNIFSHFWDQDRSLDLGGLIGAVQQPPVTRIGVMDLDAFYPAKERFALAMRLNNLLAAPGFDVWMKGDPLNAGKLLYTEDGKPRVSIMSIAHLSDSQRMFFVTMLLNELIAWMRSQPGTSTLRAILYMDEIFGFMPPVSNPPSKKPFLTLLKQARAYGVGLALATQNPVDLDYKGLSNTGTWFIGRLQTERDKARVLEGLEGAAASGDFNRQRTEEILAGLGKRRFLLHNVHEDAPVVFNTRWAMSYLSGPLTRDQISRLMARKPLVTAASQKAEQAEANKAARTAKKLGDKPVLPPGVPQYYLPVRHRTQDDAQLFYRPLLLGAAEVAYRSSRYNIDHERPLVMVCDIDDGPLAVSWEEARTLQLNLDDLLDRGEPDAAYGDPPPTAGDAKRYPKWKREFGRWLRSDRPLVLQRSRTYKLISEPNETEGEFRARLQIAVNEVRDIKVEKMRASFAGKLDRAQEKLRKAEQVIEREKEQAWPPSGYRVDGGWRGTGGVGRAQTTHQDQYRYSPRQRIVQADW